MWLDLATVVTTPTEPGIQRRKRSLKTSDRAAAGMQPKTSAGAESGEGLSRALPAHANATEV